MAASMSMSRPRRCQVPRVRQQKESDKTLGATLPTNAEHEWLEVRPMIVPKCVKEAVVLPASEVHQQSH